MKRDRQDWGEGGQGRSLGREDANWTLRKFHTQQELEERLSRVVEQQMQRGWGLGGGLGSACLRTRIKI